MIFRRIFKYIFYFLMIFLAILFIYSYLIISSLRTDRYFRTVVKNLDKKKNLFMKEGLLRKNDLNFYLTFTNTPEFDLQSVTKPFRENILEVVTSFEIEKLIENRCKASRCLQFPVVFSEIPLILIKGLIGTEDHRYLDHRGIDLRAIFRAIFYDLKALKLVQGGSTLTQQIAKNLFFSNKKNFIRKIKEAIVALYLEFIYEKDEILQVYFNEIFWGSIQGIYLKGVKAASLTYFSKSLKSLSVYEASILISMLKGPNYYTPITQVDRLRKRSDLIFSRLKYLNIIEKSSKKWDDLEWKKWMKYLKKLEENQYVESIYLSTKEKESLRFDHYRLGLAAKRLLKKKGELGKTLAVKIRLIGEDGPINYYSKFERNVKNAIFIERHQVASTIKPLIYHIGENLGYPLSSLVDLSPISLNLKSGKWSPRESHHIPEKVISYRRALQESFNLPVIKLVKDIGFYKFENELKQYIKKLKIPLVEYPAQLLGSLELSVQELGDLYQKVLKEQCIRGGEVMPSLSNPNLTTIKRRVDDLLVHQRFFGKTGTSNKGHDNWFIGLFGKQLIVIWTGVELKEDRAKHLKISGSSTSFEIFQEIVLYSGKIPNVRPCSQE